MGTADFFWSIWPKGPDLESQSSSAFDKTRGVKTGMIFLTEEILVGFVEGQGKSDIPETEKLHLGGGEKPIPTII